MPEEIKISEVQHLGWLSLEQTAAMLEPAKRAMIVVKNLILDWWLLPR